MSMRNLLGAMACVATLAASISAAHAQGASWPGRPIRFIVPFAAGGPTDGASRHITTRLEKILGQPIVVENIAGMGGGLGASRLAHADPDGYTIGLVHVGTQAINPYIYSNLGYDPLKDFAPIARLYEYSNVLVVNNAEPYKTLADLIEAAKAKPGIITFASAGIGSSNQLSTELLANKTGTKFIHVPYRGSAPAMTDLVAGNVNFMFDVLLTSQPFLDSGQLRALAVTSPTRMRQLPDVPTIAETIPGFNVVGWVGIVGPAGLPQAIVDRLTSEIEKIVKAPDTIERFSAWGFEANYGTPQQLTNLTHKDYDLWGPIVQAAGVKLDK